MTETIEQQIIQPIITGYDLLKLKENSISMNAVVKSKPDVYSSFRQFDKNLIDISNRMMAELGDAS